MVCGCDDDREHENGIQYAGDDPQEADNRRLSCPSTTEHMKEARVVKEGHANDEGIGEVQTWHGCQLVYIRASDPHTLCMLLADGILESEGFW